MTKLFWLCSSCPENKMNKSRPKIRNGDFSWLYISLRPGISDCGIYFFNKKI